MTPIKPPPLNKDDVRQRLQVACGIVYECGAGMSLLALADMVLEQGLPSAEERERIRAAKMDDTTPSLPVEPDPPHTPAGV